VCVRCRDVIFANRCLSCRRQWGTQMRAVGRWDDGAVTVTVLPRPLVGAGGATSSTKTSPQGGPGCRKG
jgi:hypothetical protein